MTEPAAYSLPNSAIQGNAVCRIRDEYGEITVAEESNRRTLYFGSIAQSTILINRPDLLLEDYNEAMMSALLFNSEPRSVLLIGLGGCSLVHFLLKALPVCAIDVAEIRKQVIDLSWEFFLLPEENPNLRIFHAAGSDFIENRPANADKYDMIIVDAFDEAGPAAALLEKDFLSSCRMQLSDNGVFSINLWNSPAHNFSAMYRSIQEAFEGNTLKLLLSETYRNAIAFGFNDPAHLHDLIIRRSAAVQLESRFGIDFPRFVKYLYWQNFNVQDQ